jgi:endonuclease III
MKKDQIVPFFIPLKAANPQPNTELEYTSVFELLAEVLLSAQASDLGVSKACANYFCSPRHLKLLWIWAYPGWRAM